MTQARLRWTPPGVGRPDLKVAEEGAIFKRRGAARTTAAERSATDSSNRTLSVRSNRAKLWSARFQSVLLIALGLFLALSLLTYQPLDVPWLNSSPDEPPHNLGGVVGVWVGFFGRAGFGWASLLLCSLCAWWAGRLWRGAMPEVHAISFVLAVVSWLSSVGTLLALLSRDQALQTRLGGVTGMLLARSGVYYLGMAGTVLTACCAGFLAWIIVSGQTFNKLGFGNLRRLIAQWFSPARRASSTAASLPAGTSSARTAMGAREHRGAQGRTRALDTTDAASAVMSAAGLPVPKSASELGIGEPKPPTSASMQVRVRSTVEPTSKASPPLVASRRPVSTAGFQMPSLDMLAVPPPVSQRQLGENLQMNARILEETLREFGIDAAVVNIDRGPTVTRYELTPAPGVKLTKIVSLADDLALVMKAANCHVVAPIPGKGRVGVDVPNTTTTIVYLKEIVTSSEFTGNASPLVLPVGTDVSGHPVVTDLRECPHLLIAGATGSGKTVCLNSLLLGILMRATPEQVRFLMVDPKMVELTMFNDIPHLIAPVVTNAKKASVALHWAVEEMERRYQLLATAGVRNIDLYNKRMASQPILAKPAASAGHGEEAEGPADDGKPLPYLVIVIDELADLMMVSSQDIEGAIARLAQLSRAVGIHIILATQRPSVDVITGVIKANFPARIAFQVASKVDSRTILDANGADKLLGRGDLLFLRPGTAKPIRAQGAYVTDAEIERITNFLKQQQSPFYDERLLEKARQPEGAMPAEKDELYDTAKQLVLDTGQASTSLLQRRLRLGYGRAARMLDLMEQEGVVGPPQGSRPREILVNSASRNSAP